MPLFPIGSTRKIQKTDAPVGTMIPRTGAFFVLGAVHVHEGSHAVIAGARPGSRANLARDMPGMPTQ